MKKTMPLMLSGDDANLPQELTEAEVNHLRRLLAWLRCEYTLDENMQRGYLQGAALCVAHGHATPEQAGALVQAKADEIAKVPAYIRQAVKMLTKAVHDHDAKTRVVDQESDGSVEGHARSATKAETAPQQSASGTDRIEAPVAGIKPGPSEPNAIRAVRAMTIIRGV